MPRLSEEKTSIKILDNKTYIRFLTSNQAHKQQVSLNDKGTHYGYFEDNNLLGVISIADTKNTKRVKGFLVNAKRQNSGIGTALLKHVLIDDKDMTAFASVHSVSLFEKHGFKAERKNENNITFMRKTATNKYEITEDDIKYIKPQLIELADKILNLDKKRRKVTINYVCRKLKEMIR